MRRRGTTRQLAIAERLNRKSKEWPKDAAGGKLSHKKMVYEKNLRHCRVIEENNRETYTEDGRKVQVTESQYKPMSCCKLKTGWFCCCKNWRQSELGQELGLGMSIYFKQLKSMALMFLIFTLLSLPSFLLFYNGNEATNVNLYDTKGFFSTFTLGNLGQSSDICQQRPPRITTSEAYCSFGTVQSLELYALASNETNTCRGFEQDPMEGV